MTILIWSSFIFVFLNAGLMMNLWRFGNVQNVWRQTLSILESTFCKSNSRKQLKPWTDRPHWFLAQVTDFDADDDSDDDDDDDDDDDAEEVWQTIWLCFLVKPVYLSAVMQELMMTWMLYSNHCMECLKQRTLNNFIHDGKMPLGFVLTQVWKLRQQRCFYKSRHINVDCWVPCWHFTVFMSMFWCHLFMALFWLLYVLRLCLGNILAMSMILCVSILY